MSRHHRAHMTRQADGRWGWPVVGGIGVGLGATLLCIPQSRNAMFHAVERLFDPSKNPGMARRPSIHGNSPYGP
ncbi:hypothetical protein [Alicyclobacillus mali (ex Roth et al. 2021)]|uniref:hypothetical protein n=1 Tax=Alicyclobacillus mali (ex Roth et al. 2021) TaxID=1123961 RepID=UPI00082A8EF4|nr:hypothetical protein [Alicyclobacillus mali (ex Roth et al. 2021)]